MPVSGPFLSVKSVYLERMKFVEAGFASRPCHITNEVDDRVAGGDIQIKLVERDATIILKVLLDLDLNVMAREVTPKPIAIVGKFVRYCREENTNGHGVRTCDY